MDQQQRLNFLPDLHCAAQWVAEHQNITITGATGVGKTVARWTATAGWASRRGGAPRGYRRDEA